MKLPFVTIGHSNRSLEEFIELETAAAPPRIIPKSLAGDRAIIDTIVNKYCAHLPLFGQSAMLERETGLELSRVTLCGWVLAVGELLMPIVGARLGAGLLLELSLSSVGGAHQTAHLTLAEYPRHALVHVRQHLWSTVLRNRITRKPVTKKNDVQRSRVVEGDSGFDDLTFSLLRN